MKRFAPTQWVRAPLAIVAVAAVILIALVLTLSGPKRSAGPRRIGGNTRNIQPEAPPDLAKYRTQFMTGVGHLRKREYGPAAEQLGSFSFKGRAVEEYRLFYLSDAQEKSGNPGEGRRTLARLWVGKPKLTLASKAALRLGSSYAAAGSWREAAETYGELAARTEEPHTAAAARAEYIRAKFFAGDPGAVLYASRNLVIRNGASQEAKTGAEVASWLLGINPSGTIPLTGPEKIERAKGMLRGGHAQAALNELSSLQTAGLPVEFQKETTLQRGLALHHLRRFDESEKTLTPLFYDQFRYAIPAARASIRNNQILASSINPVSVKTVKERKQVGTVKVSVPVRGSKKAAKPKGKTAGKRKPAKTRTRTVLKPKFAVVSRSVKVINQPLAIKKDNYSRAYVERLKDLLDMPAGPEIRKDTLVRLVAAAAEKNQDAYLRELIPKLVQIDRLDDTGLQRFWDKGWSAFVRGDLNTAKTYFDFIQTTYQNPNVKRQSEYWLARTIERSGEKQRAAAIYQHLANAPYDDLYARFSVSRGAKRNPPPVSKGSPDWPEIAEKEMPPELRLGYELSALGLPSQARQEVDHNASYANQKYADAVRGELFFAEGQKDPAYRALRRAYPQLATVEQDAVPRRFAEMYYPLHHEDHIRAMAKKRGLDPYLVMALIRQESAFNTQARSSVGAMGLMQIMPATGRELGARVYSRFNEKRLNEAEVNIELGTLYLKQLIDMLYGSTELALAGYNGGPYRIKKWRESNRGKPLDEFIEGLPLSETRNYVKRVTLLRGSYERLRGGQH